MAPAPNMAMITEYLEKSMQNCSLNNHRRRSDGDFLGRSSTKDESDERIPISERVLELNSHISIPYQWEQCLDLKTGEIYYIDLKNGVRVKDDPRKVVNSNNGDNFSGESYGTVFSEEESSYYESEGSSSESWPSSRESHKEDETEEEEDVLVVAGCKACFMYFMVPKLLQECPKCAAKLLHFARPISVTP